MNIVHFFFIPDNKKNTYICYFNSIRIRIPPSIQNTIVTITHFLFQSLCKPRSLILTYSPFRNRWSVWCRKVSLQWFILGINFCKHLHNLECFQNIFIKHWVKNLEIKPTWYFCSYHESQNCHERLDYYVLIYP